MSITKVSNFVLGTDSVTLDNIAVIVEGTAGQVLSTDGNGNLLFADKLVTEDVQDIVGGLLNAGTHTNITIDYDDVNNTLSLNATGAVESVNTFTGAVVLGTDDISEGTSNLYYTQSRFDTALNAKSTSDLSEGTNFYYTDARARNAISATGSLSYNSTTGELSYTERTDTEIRSLFSAGTGVSITNGAVAIGQDVSTTSDVVFSNLRSTGNIQVDGNLTISGTTTTINTETINLADNIILLNSNEAGSPTQSSGIEIERGTGNNVSFLWDETGDYWSIGSENLVTSGVFLGNLTGAVTGTVSSLANHDTGDLSEGTNLYYTSTRANSDFDTRLGTKSTSDLSEGTNLYFTNERVDDRVSNLLVAGTNTDISYDDNANTLTISAVSTGGFDLSANDTDDLPEGSTNLYYTDARARGAISATGSLSYDNSTGVMSFTMPAQTTTAITEGTNLYFTNERVDDRVSNLLVGGQNITVSYDDAANTLTINGVEDNFANNTTDDLSEGTTNLYYTDDRVEALLATFIVINDTSEFGELVWNDETGRIDHHGITSSEIYNLLSASNGVSYDGSGGFELDSTYSPTFANLTLNGNLTVSGTTTTVNTEELLLADNIVTLNSNLSSASQPSENAGFEINRGAQSTVAIRWNETTDKWQFTNDGSVYKDIGSLSSSTTDELTEGSSNLYFTNERAQDTVASMITAGDNISVSYDDASNTLTITGEVEDDLSNNSTSDLSEGTNLYFTNERVDDRVSALLVGGDNVTITYDDASNSLRIDAVEDDLSNNSTSDLSEGTNLYYTEARTDARVNVLRTDLATSGDSVVHFNNITNVPTVDSQTINGTGATSYSLNVTPGSAEAIIVTISGVMQTPGSDYSVSGSTITFTSSLPTGQAAQLRFVGYQIVGGSASSDLPLQGGTMSGSILVATDDQYDLGSAAKQFRTVYAHEVEATYADLAERYAADEVYLPGTVLIFGGDSEVTVTSTMGDVSVAGVVSTEPAVKMNSTAGNDETHPYIALRGRVPCRVIGAVQKGDLIVTSDVSGYGVSVGKNDMGRAVFAKAIETNLSDGEKVVEVVIV